MTREPFRRGRLQARVNSREGWCGVAPSKLFAVYNARRFRVFLLLRIPFVEGSHLRAVFQFCATVVFFPLQRHYNSDRAHGMTQAVTGV